MAGRWTRLNVRRDDPKVVRQRAEEGCGAACGEMLLSDRAVAVSQDVLAEDLRLPASAEELALRLNQFSPPSVAWVGGTLNVDPPPPVGLLQALGEHGSWAALLKRGRRVPGHWVVVDRVTAEAVAVRDPEGASYEVPYEEFVELLGYLVVVFDRGAAP